MRVVESRVWVAGSGRSGTTWLGLALAAPRGSAFLFEPLHSWYARFPADLTPPISDASDRPYFHAGADVPSWRRYIEHVLGGSGFTRRTMCAGRRRREHPRALWCALTGKRLVVKAIRSNLMLGWLAEVFDLPIVLLLRHPCATVASQVSCEWGVKRDVVEVLRRQPELVQDHLKDDLERLTPDVLDTPVKRLAARWALENRIALAMAADDDRILPVAYEDLVLRPLRELERIFAFLSWELNASDRRRVSRALAKPRMGLRRVVLPDELLARWQTRLPAHEVVDILTVVRSLGVDFYDESSLPTRPIVAPERDIARI